MSDFIWKPSEARTSQSYVTRLMPKLGAKNRTELWEKSVADISRFWDVALEDMGLEWFAPYSQTLDDSKGIAWTRWFVDGKINIAHNCVDRHRESGRTALLWEGDDGSVREVDYRSFSDQVNQVANALRSLEVGPGDTVGILMPMVPEVVIQLMGCFKVGAVAIPIFSGFGHEAVHQRLKDANAKVLFTSDVVFRRGKQVSVKNTADQATRGLSLTTVVFKRGDGACDMGETDKWWDEFVLSQPKESKTESLDAEAQSMILFTSGTTGRPKGAIHTHAGVLATVGKELRYAFNMDEHSRFFWFTDIGWMMGPWEMIGATLFGGTLFLFEGAPDYPHPGRLWETIERHRITHLGISPTAIRVLKKHGLEPVEGRDLSSLQILGSTGETWDEDSYQWFFDHVGQKRCPVINISGGTEIMGCLLSPLPIDPLQSCTLGGPGLGVDADVFDEQGQSVREDVGHLVCKQPLPSMTKSFLKDDARYEQTYFTRFPGVWYHGDWARVDAEGQWFLHGRSDDTIKIAGKRVGPNDFESALNAHPQVAEAAAVGVPDEVKGEACICYVVLKSEATADDALRSELRARTIDALGKSLAPREILFVDSLPKTRSAKVVRGVIRKVYLNEPLGDTASIENPQAIDALRAAT